MYSLRRGVLDGAKSATACIMSLRLQMKLVDFNLAISTQTAKPPNLIPYQIW